MIYIPRLWFWIVQDSSPGTQAWKGATGAFVGFADADYVAFLADGNSPTSIDTFVNLCEVIDSYNQSAGRVSSTTLSSATNIILINIVALFNKVSISTTGKSVTMPQANLFGSVPIGVPIRFSNTGSNSVAINRSDGVWISNVQPSGVLEVFLNTNATAAGTYTTNNQAPLTISTNVTPNLAVPVGSILNLIGADGVQTRLIMDAFAENAVVALRSANGSAAAPSAVLSGNHLGSFGVRGYGATGWAPFSSSIINFYASENWTDTAQGSKIVLETTPNGSTTRVERVYVENDGGIVVPPTVTGGSKGAGTINAAALYQNGVAVPTTRPAFSVHRNGSNQTAIATSTFTKVQFTTEEFDTNSNFDNATNYRFQPTVAGKYIITASATFVTINAGCFVVVSIFKNGARYKDALSPPFGGANDGGCLVAVVVDFNGSSDYVEAFAFHNHGSNRDLYGNSNLTYMTGVHVS